MSAQDNSRMLSENLMTASQYVFIESRDPFESSDTGFVIDAAEALHARGRSVTIFLVQNGVLATRSGAARSAHLGRVARAGITVLADDFSLRERGIEVAELWVGVCPASIEMLVDLMVRLDTKTVWH
jgi:sulfur transfer complex TusBCD TusB component (DsrH family)